MFIADHFINIKSTEENTIEDGMIEKLDEMLTENGIQHVFTLPIESEDGIAKDPEVVLSLGYEEVDDMAVSLVYMLWAKTVRKVSDERISKWMSKMTSKEEKAPQLKSAAYISEEIDRLTTHISQAWKNAGDYSFSELNKLMDRVRLFQATDFMA